MRIIPVGIHNVLDYVYGIIIAASPWLLGFDAGGTETYTAVFVGLLILIMSLITNYKYSAAKFIAYNSRLKIDMVLGFFLLSSPWLFGFNDYIYLPHLLSGLFVIILNLMSKKFVNYREY